MNWYCAQVKTGEERAVEQRLEQMQYNPYCPLVLADRRVQVVRHPLYAVPMFPAYLFFQATEGETDFHPVKKTPGLLRILTHVREDGFHHPEPVPASLIEWLQSMEDEQGVHRTKHDYQEGDRLRIRAGPFQGYEAIVAGTPRERVHALLEFMGKQHRVRLDRGQVEPLN